MPPYSGIPTGYASAIDTSGIVYPESRARMYEPEIYRKRKLRKYSSSSFVANGQRVALVEKKMSQRLNKDRVVRMKELYDTLYPVRTVVTESSFSMSNPVGQKMTCMNVFRHQDLDVLDPAAATTAVMTSGSRPFGGQNPLNVITNDSVDRNLTQSGYVMRGYGVALQNTSPNSMVVQSQMHIGPGNHKPGVAKLSDTLYNQLVGNRYNVDTSRYTSVFDGGTGAAGSREQQVTVQYPNLDVSKIGIGDIMGCCQTLWSPVCCQSIEAASANLGFNTLGTGTTEQIGGHLTNAQASSSDIDVGVKDFGPQPETRAVPGIPAQAQVTPRGNLDPESARFTWTKHSVDYKFNNTYNYPLDVEVVVLKAHGLTSRQQVTGDDVAPTAFYPGVNGPLPWTNTNGGFFSVLYGKQAYNDVATTGVNRSFILDFIGQWTSKLGAIQRRVEGIQLPLAQLPTGYPNQQTSIGRFQKAAMSHWPIANARWANFGRVKGQSAGHDFLREFSRKSMRIRPGEQCSLDLDLGGFKYSLADVGYLVKQVTTGTDITPFTFPSFTTDDGFIGKEQYKFSSKGLMNGSVVVCITLKGTPMTANAPLLAVGPAYPTTQYGTQSLGAGPNPAVVDTSSADGTVGQDTLLPPGPDQVPRGNYATGVTHSAGTLLVECREKISFQPMMNKRAKFRQNTVTNTNHSLLITPTVPVDATVRTVDSVTLKTYTTSTVKNSEDSRQTEN